MAAADWPQFRGPAGNGHADAKNLPTTWNETTNVAWKAEIPGKGWSSPSLFQNRLYLTTAVPSEAEKTQSLSLRLCIDAANGKILWDAEVLPAAGRCARDSRQEQPRQPDAARRRQPGLCSLRPPGTACLDLAGTILWKDTAHAYEPVHGNGGSPVLVDGPADFQLRRRRRSVRRRPRCPHRLEKWRFARSSDSKNKFSFSTPDRHHGQAGNNRSSRPAPASSTPSIRPPAAKSGKSRYGDGYSVIPKPVFGHGLLFVATGYNTPNVMAIRPDGRAAT